MSESTQTTSQSYKFFIVLSTLGIIATVWSIYLLFPYNRTPSTEVILAIVGFNVALLSGVGIVHGHNKVEYNWNQRVLAGVCIDSLILIMISLLVVALFPFLSLTSILLTILCFSASDIYIRHTIVRRKEG